MDHKYSFQKFNNETMARAVGRSMPISVKHSVEVANAIRGMSVSKAKKYLEEVMELKQPVTYRRFNDNLGHKKKIGPGRFPIKTAKYFLGILKLAESNALFKGLSAQDLVIVHVNANKSAGQWHFGRKRRRQFKSSHLEIVVEEIVEKKKKAEPKKEVKKEKEGQVIAKTEAKPAAAKTEIKAESEKKEKEEPKAKPAQQNQEKAEKSQAKKEENKKQEKLKVKQDDLKETSQSPKQNNNTLKEEKDIKEEKEVKKEESAKKQEDIKND